MISKHTTNLKQTFYEWCVNNSRKDLLERWDYELNDCTPKDIGFKTKKKFWFKCDKNKNHHSELHGLGCLIKHTDSLKCRQCNSFGQWCVDNKRNDILDRWDYDLNSVNPFDIPRGTAAKFYFKCPSELHESELQNVGSLTCGNINDFYCKSCNSFAQWCIDNICDDFLEKYWDYDKNTKDPWVIAKSHNGKVWIKCQEKTYHGSYEVSCNKFIDGKRCPYCSMTTGKINKLDSLGSIYPKSIEVWSDKNDKTPFEYTSHTNKKIWFKCCNGIHEDYLRSVCDAVSGDFTCVYCNKSIHDSRLQKKVSDYIKENYNYTLLHEFNCTLKPRNPNTGCIMPFDNEIKELNLIIEVNGEQHYRETKIWNDINFEERKFRDEYKKNYAINNGYYFLEIPYTLEKNDKYKTIIDEKINDILNS